MLTNLTKSCPKSCSDTIDTEDENLNMKGLILKVLNENKELVHTISEQQKTIQSMVPKLGNNNTPLKNRLIALSTSKPPLV